MSDIKHTPGPWRLDSGGVIRTTASEAGQQYARGFGLPQVALVVGLPETRPDGERDANARLIAAAPELLEAGEELEVAVSMAFGPDREDVIRKAAAKMRAAIAKAEGKP